MPANALVLFGATGDLARKKIGPALLRLAAEGRFAPGGRLVAYGRTPLDDDAFRARWRRDLAPMEKELPAGLLDRFLAHCHYVAGDYGDADTLRRAGALRPASDGHTVWYAALPPTATERLLPALEASGAVGPHDLFLAEKPFGLDGAGAKRLNALLARQFPENRLVRLDHYLAKDTVRNLQVFRFGNLLFEPAWNRHYVDSVQVTAAEDIGCEGRGGYYDEAGVVRDVLQNHVLLMLALILMEPPRAGDAEAIRDNVADFLKSLVPPGPEDFVLGQYDGYRDEPGVKPGSATPTFAAVRLQAATWRWEGVPIYLRAGKRLPRRVSEVVVRFKRVPLCVLSPEACLLSEPNELVFRIQPNESVRLSFAVAAPGEGDRVQTSALSFRYDELEGGAKPMGGYERVLADAFAGNGGGWRGDGVEAAWRVMEPLLAAEAEAAGAAATDTGRAHVIPYAAGTWGPEAARNLPAAQGRRWHEPDHDKA